MKNNHWFYLFTELNYEGGEIAHTWCEKREVSENDLDFGLGDSCEVWFKGEEIITLTGIRNNLVNLNRELQAFYKRVDND